MLQQLALRQENECGYGFAYTVVVHTAPAPPGHTSGAGGRAHPDGTLARGHPHVHSNHVELSTVRETTGLCASGATATPTRSKGPVGESLTE